MSNKPSQLYSQHQTAAAPMAAQRPKALTEHGDTRIDEYYWLNDRNDQEVIGYLQAENQYLDALMGHLKPLQEQLFAEMRGRIKEQDQSVPYRDNGYYYFTRYEQGLEYPIYARKKGSLQAAEEIMLNVNEMAEGYGYFSAAGLSVSPNNKLLAFGQDTLGRRIYSIRFKDLQTGAYLPDELPNTTGGAVWAMDNQHIFYSVKDETLRDYKIMRHKLGTPASADVTVYEEKDATFSCAVYRTKSDRYLVIASFQTLSTEYRLLEADKPTGEFRVFQPRERGLEYSIEHFGDHFYVRTNLNARNFRLMRTSLKATTKDNWRELVPHREDVLLEDMDVFRDYLVLSERKAGITQLRIMPWKGGGEHYIAFQEDAYVAGTSVNLEFDTDELRISYQSMTTPPTTYDYNMRTRNFNLLKQQEVLGGFSVEDYRSERVYVTARDGAKVPVSIVYHKNFVKNGQNPLLLYGYGSYGNSMDPFFSAARLSLLNRGFAFAIAHVRGGEEMGRHWYEDGKLLNKKNTFYDFIDCAEHLIAAKYTSKEQLFAQGGSAGGLLMGAVINMRPDLWKGVIAAVPFVDVVTTMLDESIPLTTGEFDEWGNPKDATYYNYMKSYSPYDNVAAVSYPALLVTTGLHDSQVQYWEPAKWVARMRKVSSNQNPILLYTNMEAGHGGASGRFRRLKEVAMEYSFLLELAGKTGL